ncbi:MAG: Na/Pi cotransporter family protein [Candidatus Coproplasma sp.]
MNFEQVMLIVNSLFFILGGVVVFMMGMEMMGSNLEKTAGSGIRKLMGKAAKNRFVGIGTGAVITAVVNSSSATTVMIVGFVNVGLMTLAQAASVIMGANIGTTISAFIMALSSTGSAIDIAAIFAVIAFVGLMMTMVSKKENIKRIGNILIGVGLIFVGLEFMSLSVKSLIADGSPVKSFIENMFISLGNAEGKKLTWQIPVLFILGLVLTALMQASSAITGIVITLASNGLMTLPMAMCVILGTNIGTCCTSLLSSIGTSTNARRAAVVHLLFNVLGCFIFIWPVAFFGDYIAQGLSFITDKVQWQVAIFHMFFNVLTTLILVWFTKYIVKLACILVPESKKVVKEEPHETLDVRLLKTPAIAVGQARKEIVRMGQLAFSNYKRSLDMLLSYNVDGKEEFAKTEKEIDNLNKYITQFLIKLSSEQISEVDEKKVSSFYHVTSDIERIGDYAENITEFAQQMVEANAKFSEHAVEEIREMDLHLSELYKNVEIAFATHNLDNLDKIKAEEDATDKVCKVMHASHIRRTNEGRCTPEAGSVYLQLAVNMERIGDHMFNVANSVSSYAVVNKEDRSGL